MKMSTSGSLTLVIFNVYFTAFDLWISISFKGEEVLKK